MTHIQWCAIKYCMCDDHSRVFIITSGLDGRVCRWSCDQLLADAAAVPPLPSGQRCLLPGETTTQEVVFSHPQPLYGLALTANGVMAHVVAVELPSAETIGTGGRATWRASLRCSHIHVFHQPLLRVYVHVCRADRFHWWVWTPHC
jgi:hypothetical protein